LRKPPKLDRKELKKPDEFVKRGQQALASIVGHRGFWIPFVAIIIVGSIGTYAYNLWSASHSEKAWRGYLDAQRAPEDKRWDEMKAFYNKVYSSRPRMFAAVALADHYFQDAKKEALKEGGDPSKSSVEAAEWYGKALEYKSILPTERQLLLVDRGNAKEVGKKLDEAYADYRQASELEGDVKALGMLGMGRIHELKNETDKAATTYTQVSSQFADSEYGKVAKNYLRRMKSPLFKDDPNKL
jgi:hypothetical protein